VILDDRAKSAAVEWGRAGVVGVSQRGAAAGEENSVAVSVVALAVGDGE